MDVDNPPNPPIPWKDGKISMTYAPLGEALSKIPSLIDCLLRVVGGTELSCLAEEVSIADKTGQFNEALRCLKYINDLGVDLNEKLAECDSLVSFVLKLGPLTDPSKPPIWFENHTRLLNILYIYRLETIETEQRLAKGRNIYPSSQPTSPHMQPPTPGIAISSLNNGLWVNKVRPQQRQNIDPRSPYSTQPRRSQSNHINKTRFVILPQRQSAKFTEAQLQDIRTKVEDLGGTIFLIGRFNTPLAFHKHKAAREFEMSLQSSFPLYRIEISTNKWIRIFVTNIQLGKPDKILQASPLQLTDIFLKELELNQSIAPYCSSLFAKVTRINQAEKGYLRVSMLVHPYFHLALTKSQIYFNDTPAYWKDDAIISKCYVCSELGHNNPECQNPPSCPFRGSDRALLNCFANLSLKELKQPRKCLTTQIKTQSNAHDASKIAIPPTIPASTEKSATHTTSQETDALGTSLQPPLRMLPLNTLTFISTPKSKTPTL